MLFQNGAGPGGNTGTTAILTSATGSGITPSNFQILN